MESLNRRRFITVTGVGAPLVGVAGQAPAQNDVRTTIERELRRTKPDYVAYVPGHWDGSTHDSLNEHFLVFDGPDQSLMAVWTQSDGASGGGSRQKNRIRFSRSADEGATWEKPSHVAGPTSIADPAPMTSWAFPMVAKSGRIYVVFNQNDGQKAWIQMHTGTMAGVYSDDRGRTWSRPQDTAMPASPHDDPAGKVPPEWIVWQRPMRDLTGGYFAGYTRWLHPARARWKNIEAWTQIESVVEFMRFENVDADPEPRDLKIRYSAWGDKALRAPYYRDPLLSIAQEPSLVRLPDKSLFCAMRSNSGYLWYSLSKDDGRNWCNPRPLLRRDFGEPLLHPVSCSPIYQLADGRYVLFHHNHRGDFEARPEKTHGPRVPSCLVLGEFRPNADQPIWFSESKQLMDLDNMAVNGLPVSPQNPLNSGLSLYSSFTTRRGNNVLWYPERKFFLLGKKIDAGLLAGLSVPSQK